MGDLSNARVLGTTRLADHPDDGEWSSNGSKEWLLIRTTGNEGLILVNDDKHLWRMVVDEL